MEALDRVGGMGECLVAFVLAAMDESVTVVIQQNNLLI